MTKIKKFWKIFCCCVIAIIGISYSILSVFIYEEKDVYWEIKNPEKEYIQIVEEIVDMEFSDTIIIESMKTGKTFVPDTWQNVEVYYRENGNEKEQCMNVSYFDARSNALVNYIIENGIEHRERLTVRVVLILGVTVILILVLIVPYRKIYNKLNGV